MKSGRRGGAVALLALAHGLCAADTQILTNGSPSAKKERKIQHELKHIGATIEQVLLRPDPCHSGPRGMVRKGLLFRRPGARATVIMSHGFMCDKTDIRFLRYIFEAYNVLMFDFRAHGEVRDQQCCTFGSDEAADVQAAVAFVRNDPELKKVPVISYAFSMGAVASINAQARYGKLFDCAIWDCPFDSTEGILVRSIDNLQISLFGYKFPMPGRSFLKKYAYNWYVQSLLKTALKTVAQMDTSQVMTHMVPIDAVEAAHKISIPTFLIVCKKDSKAPPSAVKKIYDALGGYKRLWITNGRFHFDSFFSSPEEYAYRVRRFIEKFLNNEFEKAEQQKVYTDSE